MEPDKKVMVMGQLKSSVEREEETDPQPLDPLLINEILTHVLEYMEVSDLLTCRLVNHHWDDVATAITDKRNDRAGLKTTFSAGIGSNGRTFEKFCQTVSTSSRGSWPAYLRFFWDWNEARNRRLYLRHLGQRMTRLSLGHPQLDVLQDILNHSCSSLRVLGIIGIEYPPEVMDFKVNKDLHQLKSLTFTSSYIEPPNNPLNPPDCRMKVCDVLAKIIQASKTLSEVNFPGAWTQLVTQILIRPELNNSSSIHKLVIGCGFTPAYFGEQAMIRARNSAHKLMTTMMHNSQFSLPVRDLCLHDINPSLAESISSIVSKLGRSLQVLSIKYNVPPDHPLPKNFVLSTTLQNLVVFKHLGERAASLQSIDVVSQMPNLQILWLSGCEQDTSNAPSELYWSDEIDNIFQNGRKLINRPHLKLKELHLFGAATTSFDTLPRIFPNLKRLSIGLHAHDTPVVWEETDDMGVKFYNKYHRIVSRVKTLKFLEWLNLGLPPASDVVNRREYVPFLESFALHQLEGIQTLCLRDYSKRIRTVGIARRIIHEFPHLRRLYFQNLAMYLNNVPDFMSILKAADICVTFNSEWIDKEFNKRGFPDI